MSDGGCARIVDKQARAYTCTHAQQNNDGDDDMDDGDGEYGDGDDDDDDFDQGNETSAKQRRQRRATHPIVPPPPPQHRQQQHQYGGANNLVDPFDGAFFPLMAAFHDLGARRREVLDPFMRLTEKEREHLLAIVDAAAGGVAATTGGKLCTCAECPHKRELNGLL